jgi:hypothetical protein
MRGRRREAGIELRKSRREEQMLKKRNVDAEAAAEPLGEHRPQSGAVASLDEIIAMVKCPDAAAQMYGTTKCRYSCL